MPLCASAGGLLLCQGKSSLKLTNVKLDDCQLIVTDGATATLDDVQITHAGQLPAAVISGEGTLVRSEHCGTYKPGEVSLSVAAGSGFVVERGAAVIVEHVRVKGVQTQGFSVKGKGTILQISKSYVEGTGAALSAAVSAAGETIVELDGSILRKCADGVRARDDALVSLRGCSIEAPVGCSDVAGVRMQKACVVWQNSIVKNAETGWIRLDGVPNSPARRQAEKLVRPRVDVRINTRTSTEHTKSMRNSIETTIL